MTSAPGAVMHTRVGRRFLALFLVSAFVPVCALAILTWRGVREQLEQQSQLQLRDEAKRLALDLVGRLHHASREARDIAARPTPGAVQAPDAMIDQVAILSVDGFQVRGADSHWEPLRGGQPKLLQAGEPVLLRQEGQDAHLWVGILSSGESTALIAARIRTSRLLDDAVELTVPQTSTVLVTDDRGRLIHGAGDGTTWPAIPDDTSGLLAWTGDDRWVGAYFKPPLAALYGVSHWTIAVARLEADVYAPVSGFIRQFALVVVFTIGVVSLLSLSQVRRQLVPLSQLRDSTRRLAEQDFTTRVVINSGDEFEELAQSFDQMRGALRQTFDTLESRSEIDRAVLSALDTNRIATTVVSSTARVVPSSAVACILVNDDGTSTTTVWRARHDATALTIRSGPLHASDFADVHEWVGRQRLEAPSIVQALAQDDASHLLAVPVHVDQQLAAVLVLVRTSTVPFQLADRDIVTQIARQVAVALTNAGLVRRLERLNIGTLNALARTIDAKSPWTAGHSERVTAYGVALAQRLGLTASTIAEMERGGLLHDIGKIAIPSHILDKPSALTPEETAIVRQHPEVGARILEPLAEYAGALPIVLEHHEHWDGNGYPYGLRGDDISLGGRIFALADVFDALTSDRPYRRGWSAGAVVTLLHNETGRQFDPALTPTFVELIPDLMSHAPSLRASALSA